MDSSLGACAMKEEILFLTYVLVYKYPPVIVNKKINDYVPVQVTVFKIESITFNF